MVRIFNDPVADNRRDFRKDVSHPDTLKAEQLVLAYMHLRGWNFLDVRDKKLKWDAELSAGDAATGKLDVKADSYVDDTERAPFEVRIREGDGTFTPSWGVEKPLTYLALVGTKSWRCWFLRMEPFRDYVAGILKGQIEERLGFALHYQRGIPAGWTTFNAPNRGLDGEYYGQGWCVPLGELDRAGAVTHVIQLPYGTL